MSKLRVFEPLGQKRLFVVDSTIFYFSIFYSLITNNLLSK
jgi:hypothetical protein